MARISIYISDNLKSRMDGVGDRVNWSEIARPAFEAAIAAYEHKERPTMMTAIERLRASKQQTVQDDFLTGRQDGRDWAQDKAEHADLVRLSRVIFVNEDYRGAAQILKRAIDPQDELGMDQVYEFCFGEEQNELSDEYIAGFIEGAQDFFKEIKNEL